jgi:hypothetical protein
LLVGGVALEMVAAEILIHRTALEHLVDGSEDGGDERAFKSITALTLTIGSTFADGPRCSRMFENRSISTPRPKVREKTDPLTA